MYLHYSRCWWKKCVYVSFLRQIVELREDDDDDDVGTYVRDHIDGGRVENSILTYFLFHSNTESRKIDWNDEENGE